MFANAAASGSRMFDDELHLFHAERLLGHWQPHPRNPVKSDARCARPAGQLVWRNGALLRPAQICGPMCRAIVSFARVCCKRASRAIFEICGAMTSWAFSSAAPSRSNGR